MIKKEILLAIQQWMKRLKADAVLFGAVGWTSMG